MALLEDGVVPRTAKQAGDKIGGRFLCNARKKGNERPNVVGVSTRSRNESAPPRTGMYVRLNCAVYMRIYINSGGRRLSCSFCDFFVSCDFLASLWLSTADHIEVVKILLSAPPSKRKNQL